MDDLAAPQLPDAESEQAWFPRWVLAGYGLALGAAGAMTAYQTELVPQLRAGGVSAFVLGGGCVYLAARQGHRSRRFLYPAEPAAELVAAPVVDEIDPVEPETDEVPVPAEAPLPPDAPVLEDAPVLDDAPGLDEAERLERLEAELADERARVDRVSADLAALRRVVVEQRQNSSKPADTP